MSEMLPLKTEYELWKIGRFVFNIRTHCLQEGDKKQHLNPNEAKLLKLLILHFDNLEDRDLIREIWGDKAKGGKTSLHTSIALLRKAFGGHREEHIARGPYRLLLKPQPILPVDESPAEQVSSEPSVTVTEDITSEANSLQCQQNELDDSSIETKQGFQIGAVTPQNGTALSHRRLIYFSLAKIIVLTCALLAINWLGEKTSLGKTIKLTTYSRLQHRLVSNLNATDLPIVVVDISHLPQSSSSENGAPYASRSALQELVAAAAGSGARAVGVDIDFSPDEDGYISPNDPDFFQFCLRAKEITGVPIYLGIYRSRYMSPSAWLGEERFKELAATIIGASDNRRMVRWLQTINSSQRSFSMSTFLAGAANDFKYEPHYGLRWAVQSESNFKERYFSGKEFWIDYGPLDAFNKHVILRANSAVIRDQAKQLQGKVVLFGDINRTRDMFTIPGRRDPVPGPLLHACATYTLLNKPIYSLTLLGRLAIDLIISLVIMGGMLLIQRFAERISGGRLIILHIAFALIMAGIIIFIGCGLVNESRLMWDDLFLVAFVALAYIPVERGFRRLKHAVFKISHRPSQTWEGKR